MQLNVEALSNHDKAVLLIRLASALTICARHTYEVGTDQVTQPELLRAYNELLHRVTGAARDHILERKGYSLATILEMVETFGSEHRSAGEMRWALEQATKSL